MRGFLLPVHYRGRDRGLSSSDEGRRMELFRGAKPRGIGYTWDPINILLQGSKSDV
jgi:hypothetical protein